MASHFTARDAEEGIEHVEHLGVGCSGEVYRIGLLIYNCHPRREYSCSELVDGLSELADISSKLKDLEGSEMMSKADRCLHRWGYIISQVAYI